VFCAVSIFAQNSVSLDIAVEDAANFLSDRIPPGTSVAVFNFSSDSEKLSVYIVDELAIALANTGVNVFDRNNLDEVNREIYYGYTGAVNDDTAQSYGKDVGVQTVILGSITKSDDNEYRLRVQAIVVETKQIQTGRTFNIRPDEKLLSLLDIKIHKEYRFSNTKKIGAGFKNILFGWGSFQMGDSWGGASILVVEGGSLAALLIGAITHGTASSKAEAAFDYSDFMVDKTNAYKPGVEYHDGFYYDGVKYKNAIFKKEAEIIKNAEIVMLAGGVGLGLSLTWGFIRPFMYDKPITVQKAANVIDHLNIGIIPMNNGNTRLNISLRYNF
jgi:hypothetical protein